MKRIALADVEMAYEERGVGRVILLVHGFPLDHTMWASQIEALSKRYRVLAPDLRGFGRTPLGKYDRAVGITMERYADDLADMLDALGIKGKIVLCGFSMGGYIAWQFLRRYRERLRGLILCDTKATADSEEARAARLDMAARAAELGSPKIADDLLPKLFSAGSLKKRREIVDPIRTLISQTAPASIAAGQRGMAARPNVTATLSAIALPTLAIVGAEDAVASPAEMRSMTQAIRGAELIEIPDAGHMAPVENPPAVTEAIQGFLQKLAALEQGERG